MNQETILNLRFGLIKKTCLELYIMVWPGKLSVFPKLSVTCERIYQRRTMQCQSCFNVPYYVNSWWAWILFPQDIWLYVAENALNMHKNQRSWALPKNHKCIIYIYIWFNICRSQWQSKHTFNRLSSNIIRPYTIQIPVLGAPWPLAGLSMRIYTVSVSQTGWRQRCFIFLSDFDFYVTTSRIPDCFMPATLLYGVWAKGGELNEAVI